MVNVPSEELEVGERVLVAGQRQGVIRFSGETDFAPGECIQGMLDDPISLGYLGSLIPRISRI